MPSIAETPNSEMNPTAAETLKLRPATVEPENAAAHRERNARQRQQAFAHRGEQAVEQHEDQQQADRHDERKPLLRLDQCAELAGPFQL